MNSKFLHKPPVAWALAHSSKLEVARMERSAIREVHGQHGTFLINVRFTDLPGLGAGHSIQATFNTEILNLTAMDQGPMMAIMSAKQIFLSPVIWVVRIADEDRHPYNLTP